MRSRRFRMQALMPWLGLVLAMLLMGVLVWYLLGRGRASSLELVAWDRGSLVDDRVHLVAADNDPLGPGTPRVPLLLAIRNPGPVALQAGNVVLTLPSWLRLETDEGAPLDAEADGGNPMMRYVVSRAAVLLDPGAYPTLLPGTRRLWIRPFTSPWRCTLDDDGLPSFLPAPPLDPARLADATLFWSVAEGRSERRSTGTLELGLDPALFQTAEVERPPDFPSRTLPPDSPRVDLASLQVVGTRSVACGGMIEPLTLESTVYRTPGEGRIVSVGLDDGPARVLFDLDGNDTIEAEAWSSQADGRLDRVRRTRYPLPAFLLPLPPPPVPAPAQPDTVVADSLVADSAAVSDSIPADTTGVPAPVPSDTAGVLR